MDYRTKEINNEMYIVNDPAGGGTAASGVKIISKYQKGSVYYDLIHYYYAPEGSNSCGYDCSNVDSDELLSKYSRFFKFKYGVREDDSKYIISLEYLN